ncbi:MAG: peroxiredoxin [Gammaproteobacteria bacterium]
MSLRIGDIAPDFVGVTTHGPIHFHQWLGDSWGLLFSHHKDFTPVCTTELGSLAQRQAEFDLRNVKLIGLSIDELDDHFRWLADIAEITGKGIAYPIIADEDGSIAERYEMIPGSALLNCPSGSSQTVRCVYFIGPDKRIKAEIAYPQTTGRDFDEVLRMIDSIQLADQHPVVTPAEWEFGEDVVIAPGLSNELALERFPEGWREIAPYIRVIPQPDKKRKKKPEVA